MTPKVDTAPRSLRIGTRGSALALAQATLVARALQDRAIDHELVIIETAGDRRTPDTAWGEGAFVTAIERALVEDRIDVAVHSAKDVPTQEDPRLTIAAFLPREESRDALVLLAGRTESIDTLPAGTVVGTDSPRRTGFIRARRPDLEVRPLHGNVDTRLRRLDQGDVGALVVAAAGLIRLGRSDRITQLLPYDVVPPAPGQGAIAVQVRAADTQALEIVATIDHASTRVQVEAERAFLNATGGGCRAPIGSWCVTDRDRIVLHGGFASIDGRAAAIQKVAGPAAERLLLAERLAKRIVSGRSRLPGAPRVLVTRPEADSAEIVARLAEHGIAAVNVPAIDIELLHKSPDLCDALDRIEVFDWVVITSANAARSIGRAGRSRHLETNATRWAAVGDASARQLGSLGVHEVWVPSEQNAATLARELPLPRNARVLWVHGELAEPDLSDILVERGARLTAVVGYRTVVGPGASRRKLAKALGDARVDAVLLASPSAAKGLSAIARASQLDVLCLPAICVGDKTAQSARDAGFTVAAVASTPDASGLAEVTADFIVGARDAQLTAGALT